MAPNNNPAPTPDEHLPIPKTEAEFRELIDKTFKKNESSAPPTAADGIPAATYKRLSQVDPTAPQYSFDIQDKQIEDFAHRHNLKIVLSLSDPDYSGRNSRRPGWRKLLAAIKSGKVKTVLIYSTDRVFRNAASFIILLDLAARYKVRVLFVNEPFDSESPVGRMVLVILAVLAEFFLRLTSQRVREMKIIRYERGLPNGSYRLGYCNGLCSHCTDPNGPGYCPLVGGPDRGDGRVLVPHPIEKYACQLLAYRYHDHCSYKEIADYLNSNVFSLPDGSQVRFRTKGVVGQSAPGLFSADSIRIKILSPFDAGFVARYPSTPLDMRDDPEHPDRKFDQPEHVAPEPSRRTPLQLITGRHEAIIPFELWQQNQIIRQSKSRTPTSTGKPKRINPYTSVSRCWLCFTHDHELATLRGSTGSTDGRGYARCGRYQSTHRRRKKPAAPIDQALLSKLKLAANPISRELIDQHRNLPLVKIELGFAALIDRLIIPTEWYDLIIAYFLNDDGLLEFKRQSYDLQQELERIKSLHADQFLSRSQALEKIARVNGQLHKLQPSAHPAAALLKPLLPDFQKMWRQFTPIEQRGLLTAMFTGVFFDADGSIQLTLANSPFDALLGLMNDKSAAP